MHVRAERSSLVVHSHPGCIAARQNRSGADRCVIDIHAASALPEAGAVPPFVMPSLLAHASRHSISFSFFRTPHFIPHSATALSSAHVDFDREAGLEITRSHI